jgi:NAD(P)-dependent dehydrogenase (short-subunit alcohol dehydrogenase family)
VDARGAVALIVGASGGIGTATVHAFARAGSRLVLSAPQHERAALEALATQVRAAGGDALVVPADITSRAEIDGLVEAALAHYGRIDVLANIAGIGSRPSLVESTDDEIVTVIDVNLIGCARLMHAVIPAMRAQGGGSIVNVGSVAGEAGVMGVYSASKFGMRGLCDSVRREVRSFGIGVTLIEPGFVRTQMNAAMGDGLPGPEIVADAIVRSVRHPRRVRIVPFSYVLPVVAARLLPGLFDLVFGDARIQDRLNRDARAAAAAAAAREVEIEVVS